MNSDTLTQLDLFAGPAARPRRPTITERFADFDSEHPEVYDLFRRFARELLSAGHRRYSADGIGHRIRWHYATGGRDFNGYKLNNIYVALYARKLVAECPEFTEFFEFRRRRAAGEAEG